jgi:subtilisin family serine protease
MEKLKKKAPKALSAFLALLMTMSLFSNVVLAEIELTYGHGQTPVTEQELTLTEDTLVLQGNRGGLYLDDFGVLSLYAGDAEEFLTYTLGEALGAIGFEGAFAHTGSPSEWLEVAVTFVTPPAVALRLLGDTGHTLSRSMNFEATALEAHTLFHSQLLIVPFSSGGFEIVSSHHNLFNGVFMNISADLIEWVASLDGVFAVSPAPRFYTTNDLEINNASGTRNSDAQSQNVLSTPQTLTVLGANAQEINPPPERATPRDYFNAAALETWQMDNVWAFMADLGYDRPGYGLRIGVLDTGIDYWHPVFENSFDETLGRARGTNFIPNNPRAGANAPADPNNIMEARPGQLGFGTAVGPTSHGTHVAGTIAAIAPYAQLYHYRVLFGSTPNTIIAQGIEAAHADNMDIVNMSLGANVNVAFDTQGRMINLAVLDGITFTISAGNNNAHVAGSHGTPGSSAPLSISVGAGMRGGVGQVSLVGGGIYVDGTLINSALSGRPFGLNHYALTDVTEYVFLGNPALLPNWPGDESPNLPAWAVNYIANVRLDGNDLTGQVAVFSRGFNFTDMRTIAQTLNAHAWMVVDNQLIGAANSLWNINPATGGLSGNNAIASFIVQNIYAPLFAATGQFNTGEISISGYLHYTPMPDNISDFSSRGPINVTQHVRPDIVGPGSGIISAVPSFIINPAVAPGPSEYHYWAYGSSQGTSMSAPAVAGVAALLLTVNPEMEPAEVKARIMNTAVPLTGTPSAAVTATNGGPFYSVFNQGAGFADPMRMFEIGSTFATVIHDVPHGGTAANPIWLEDATMSSLSFGVFAGESIQLPVTFNNAVGVWSVQSFTFNGNHTGVSLEILPNEVNAFNIRLVGTPQAAQNRHFEGNIIFTNGIDTITMPFGGFHIGYQAAFSFNQNWLGVVRPHISGFVREYVGQDDPRDFPSSTIGAMTNSNFGLTRFGIIDPQNRGPQSVSFYAIDLEGIHHHLLTFASFPVNSNFNLSDFLNPSTSDGDILPDGVYTFYARINHQFRPHSGPIGDFVISSERPTVIFDEEVFYIDDEATSVQITGRLYSPGHELILEHGITSIATGEVFDYTNTWWMIPALGDFQGVLSDAYGNFEFGLTVAPTFETATIGVVVLDGDGLGPNVGTPPQPTFVASNVSLLTDVTITRGAPEVVPGHTITFEVDGLGGDIVASIYDDGNWVPILSGDNLPTGSTVRFAGLPAAGFAVERWSLAFVSNDTVAPAAANQSAALPTFTIHNLSFDHHVTVSFRGAPIIDGFPVTFDVAQGEGTIQAIIGNIYGYDIYSGAIVPAGSDIVFVAVPEPGWAVYSWETEVIETVGITPTSASNVFWIENLQSAVHVSVTFEYVGVLDVADVEISGNQMMTLDSQQQLEYVVLDSFGNEIPYGYDLTWSVYGDVNGVYVDQNGYVTVTGDAPVSTYVNINVNFGTEEYASFPIYIVAAAANFTVIGVNQPGLESFVLNGVYNHAGLSATTEYFEIAAGYRLEIELFVSEGYQLVNWNFTVNGIPMENIMALSVFGNSHLLDITPLAGFEIVIAPDFAPIPTGGGVFEPLPQPVQPESPPVVETPDNGPVETLTNQPVETPEVTETPETPEVVAPPADIGLTIIPPPTSGGGRER